MAALQRITPLPWYDRQAEEAAKFYVSVPELAPLGAGGDPRSQMCGWLEDRCGLSWQISPREIHRYFEPSDSPQAARAFTAMMSMKKLDLDAIRRAYEGATTRSTA